MDNCSSDDTISITNEFIRENTRVHLISGKDKGIYDAMNKGVQKSKGEWIYFLGSDDLLFDKHVLSKANKEISESKPDLLYGNVKVKGENLWSKDGNIYDGEFNVAKLFKYNVCHQSIFYKRSLFEEIGYFNVKYSTCADWDFNHRCFAKFRTHYFPEIIAVFHAGGESTKSSVDEFTRMDSVINLRKYYDFSYFNKVYDTYSWPLWNVSNELLYSKNYIKSVLFFIYATYHSSAKWNYIKNYFRNFIESFRKTT